MAHGLSPRMHQAVSVIQSLTAAGCTPSYDELRAALGLRSKSGVCRLIAQLELRGYVRRLPGQARSLAVVRTVAPVPLDEEEALHRAAHAAGITIQQARMVHAALKQISARPARDVPPGASWAFRDHRPLSEVAAAAEGGLQQ